DSDQRLHPAVRPHCRVVSERQLRGNDWDFLASADLVIVEYGHYYPLLELLPALVGGKARILFDYHGITPPHLWQKAQGRAVQEGALQRGLVWCADAAVAHSHFTRQELLDRTGFPAERVRQLGHAIDPDWLNEGDGAAFRRWLGLESETLLLYVGRLAPNKRVSVLVEALARLRERRPAVHAVIIGDQSDIYEAEARRCRFRARELDVADGLHMLGHVDDQRLRDAYRAADLFVMPSRHEGFCIPVVEALACGLPVVAARAGALPETVSAAGLTFVPDDVDDLVRQIGRVLDSANSQAPVRETERRRVAAVAVRYGPGFAGGAETSLRTIAESLQQAGHNVEVFTTCTLRESNWINQCEPGDVEINGIKVHRYPLDPHDE